MSENQGSCGSCAFFATAGTLDALYRIKKSKTIDTSEEELYDCVQSEQSKASCGGQHVAYSKIFYFSKIKLLKLLL